METGGEGRSSLGRLPRERYVTMVSTAWSRSGSRRRKLLGLVGVVALLAATYLPATEGHARRVADRLAAEHGCPRPLPPVVLDSVRGLTPAERCGVLSAGLALLDSLDARDARARPAAPPVESVVPTTDRVWIFAESYRAPRGRRSRTPRSDPPLYPPLSWREEAFSRSYWVFTLSRGARDDRSMAMVWVDQTTGTAHVYGRSYR